MFKAKGLESFPPATQTQDFPFKGKHKLAQEKLFTLDTNMGRFLPTDVANSLQIIQYMPGTVEPLLVGMKTTSLRGRD